MLNTQVTSKDMPLFRERKVLSIAKAAIPGCRESPQKEHMQEYNGNMKADLVCVLWMQRERRQ